MSRILAVPEHGFRSRLTRLYWMIIGITSGILGGSLAGMRLIANSVYRQSTPPPIYWFVLLSSIIAINALVAITEKRAHGAAFRPVVYLNTYITLPCLCFGMLCVIVSEAAKTLTAIILACSILSLIHWLLLQRALQQEPAHNRRATPAWIIIGGAVMLFVAIFMYRFTLVEYIADKTFGGAWGGAVVGIWIGAITTLMLPKSRPVASP